MTTSSKGWSFFNVLEAFCLSVYVFVAFLTPFVPTFCSFIFKFFFCFSKLFSLLMSFYFYGLSCRHGYILVWTVTIFPQSLLPFSGAFLSYQTISRWNFVEKSFSQQPFIELFPFFPITGVQKRVTRRVEEETSDLTSTFISFPPFFFVPSICQIFVSFTSNFSSRCRPTDLSVSYYNVKVPAVFHVQYLITLKPSERQ